MTDIIILWNVQLHNIITLTCNTHNRYIYIYIFIWIEKTHVVTYTHKNNESILSCFPISNLLCMFLFTNIHDIYIVMYLIFLFYREYFMYAYHTKNTFILKYIYFEKSGRFRNNDFFLPTKWEHVWYLILFWWFISYFS